MFDKYAFNTVMNVHSNKKTFDQWLVFLLYLIVYVVCVFRMEELNTAQKVCYRLLCKKPLLPGADGKAR